MFENVIAQMKKRTEAGFDWVRADILTDAFLACDLKLADFERRVEALEGKVACMGFAFTHVSEKEIQEIINKHHPEDQSAHTVAPGHRIPTSQCQHCGQIRVVTADTCLSCGGVQDQPEPEEGSLHKNTVARAKEWAERYEETQKHRQAVVAQWCVSPEYQAALAALFEAIDELRKREEAYCLPDSVPEEDYESAEALNNAVDAVIARKKGLEKLNG